MRAGSLDKRIALERRESVRDTAGQPVESWVAVAKVWASIRYPSGLETVKAGREVAVVKASIRIRRRAGIDAGMRAVFGGEVFDIEAVLPSAKFIDLVCLQVRE